MTTTLQIRAEIETAEKFKTLWERLQTVDEKTTQGEMLEMALCLLEEYLDGKVIRAEVAK